MRRFAIIRGISALVCALAVNAAIVVGAVNYRLLSPEPTTLPELDLTSIDLSFSEKPDETAPPAVQSPPPSPTAKAETEDKAETEAEAEAKAKAETEAKRLAEVTAKAEEEAKARARAEAQAKAKAEAEAKRLAEATAKAEAEAKVRARAEALAKAEAEAKRLAEAAAKAEEEAKARARAEAEAKKQAEAAAKAEAEAKKRDEEEKRKAAASQARVAVDKPPSPHRRIKPEYPKGARQRGEEGDVTLELDISEKGTVDGVRIVASCGFAELEQAAVQAVKRARFTPARRGSANVPTTTRLTLTFRLKD